MTKTKGHGGRRYILADEHGTHLIIEHDLTSADFDGRIHVKTLVPGCRDHELLEFPETIWSQAMAEAQVERSGQTEPADLTQPELLARATAIMLREARSGG